jgi:hypothetical protein
MSAAQSTKKLVAKFACASYQNGSDVATWARTNEKENRALWISPLFVSADKDCLCFILRCSSQYELAPEIISKLSFIVSIPSQLKFEPSILEIINTLHQDLAQSASIIDDIDLTISYYSSATTIYALSASDSYINGNDNFSVDPDDHDSCSSACLSHLRAYSTASLSSFYWEESFINRKTIDNSVSTNVNRWKKFKNLLKQVQSDSTTTQKRNSDPCHFDKLESFSIDGDVIVPLNSFLSSCNAREAGACLAFLVSEFAADPLVAHLSLTRRPTLLNYRARSIQQVAYTCMHM